jgi:hypothetical protein
MPSFSDPSPAVLRTHVAGAVAVVVAAAGVLAVGVVAFDEAEEPATVGADDAGWLDALVTPLGAEQPNSRVAAMTATRTERPCMG